jgi:hypothetical protein
MEGDKIKTGQAIFLNFQLLVKAMLFFLTLEQCDLRRHKKGKGYH